MTSCIGRLHLLSAQGGLRTSFSVKLPPLEFGLFTSPLWNFRAFIVISPWKIPLNCIPSPEIPREKMGKSPLEKCDIRNCPYFIAIPPGKYLTIVYPPWKFQGGDEKAPWKSDILLGSPGISKHFNSLEFPYFIAIPPENILQLYTLPGNSKEAMKKAPWKSDILLGSPGISKHFNFLEFPVFHCHTPWKISYNCIPSLEIPRRQ